MKPSFGNLLIVTLLSTTLLGCSVKSGPVGAKEQADHISQDIEYLYAGQEEVKTPIGLYDAMARGVKYNIDKRDAELSEMLASGEIDLNALGLMPSLTASAAIRGRSDQEYISARSRSGAQSLEPSQFEDQYARNANLALGWNTLDAGLGYINTKQAGDKARAVTERRRKVVQNIAQDVRQAYWRAASAQLLSDHLDGMIKRAKHAAQDLEAYENEKSAADTGEILALQKHIYDTVQDLLDERDALATAPIELAALMGLPPSAKIRLDVREADFTAADQLDIQSDVQDLEVLALMIRPEMREQNLLHRVASRDMHKTVLESFPGIGGILAYNFDSNSFLDDQDWTEASIGLTQDILKIFSLPQRYRHAGNKAAQSDIKRMAITAAVLTQVNLAVTRNQLAQDRYDLLKSMMGVNRRLQEYASAQTGQSPLTEARLLSAQMDSLLTRARLQLAYAENQNSFGRVINSLGLDPLPPHAEGRNLSELSSIMESRFENLDARVISVLLDKIREQTNLLDRNNGAPSRMQHVQPASAIETLPEKEDNKPV